jgi:hypothetical protein
MDGEFLFGRGQCRNSRGLAQGFRHADRSWPKPPNFINPPLVIVVVVLTVDNLTSETTSRLRLLSPVALAAVFERRTAGLLLEQA